MASTEYKIFVKSPNDKIPIQQVNCASDWKIKNLKEYLSIHYHSNPSPAVQRLIHAGKLLKDEVKISTLFVQSSEPQTIHCVCPIKKQDQKAESQFKSYSEEELKKLRCAYHEYLQSYYLEHFNKFANVGETAAPLFGYPVNFPQTVIHPNISSPSPPQQQSNNEINNDEGVRNTQEMQSVTQRLRQRAEDFLSDVGIIHRNRVPENGPADDVNRRANQQDARLVMGNGFIDGDNIGVDAVEVNIIDRLYMLFRFCLFLGLCFAYSSLDKALTVFAVIAYVYLYNIYRRYATLEQANIVRGDTPQNPVDLNSEAEGTAPRDQGNNSQNQHAQAGLSRMFTGMRFLMSMFYHFILALISSIIPENPPPIALD